MTTIVVSALRVRVGVGVLIISFSSQHLTNTNYVHSSSELNGNLPSQVQLARGLLRKCPIHGKSTCSSIETRKVDLTDVLQR